MKTTLLGRLALPVALIAALSITIAACSSGAAASAPVQRIADGIEQPVPSDPDGSVTSSDPGAGGRRAATTSSSRSPARSTRTRSPSRRSSRRSMGGVTVKLTWTSGVAPCYVLDSVVISRDGHDIALTVVEGAGEQGRGSASRSPRRRRRSSTWESSSRATTRSRHRQRHPSGHDHRRLTAHTATTREPAPPPEPARPYSPGEPVRPGRRHPRGRRPRRSGSARGRSLSSSGLPARSSAGRSPLAPAVPRGSAVLARSIGRAFVVLGGILFSLGIGEAIGFGRRADRGNDARRGRVRRVDRILGAFVGAAQALLVIWPTGGLLAAGPSPTSRRRPRTRSSSGA